LALIVKPNRHKRIPLIGVRLVFKYGVLPISEYKVRN
jgi:hypothetical protein